jgi:cell division transport system permease protein
MYSFFRIIRFALQDMVRNIGLSFMTIFILILMLLSMNTLLFIRLVTNEATASIRDQIDVSVYLSGDANGEEVDEVFTYIASLPEVTQAIFKSEDEVLADFRELYKDNADILSSLDELDENPLGATIVVKTKTPSDYASVIDSLSVPEYETIVESKTFTDTQGAIEKIDIITTNVERFSFALTAFFGIIAFLIIFNTVRVAIYTQRIEISIKKLVGATNWFVRGPYIAESIMFSVLSTGIAIGLVCMSIGFIDPYVGVVLGNSSFLTNYYISNILSLAGLQFGIVFFLTLFSSMLAMRRYLRV